MEGMTSLLKMGGAGNWSLLDSPAPALGNQACLPPHPRRSTGEFSTCNCSTTPHSQQQGVRHMTEQLFAFCFLKVEEISSDLLGRRRSLLGKLRAGLFGGWEPGLLIQIDAAARKMLWTLFSDVKAEHSR